MYNSSLISFHFETWQKQNDTIDDDMNKLKLHINEKKNRPTTEQVDEQERASDSDDDIED